MVSSRPGVAAAHRDSHISYPHKIFIQSSQLMEEEGPWRSHALFWPAGALHENATQLHVQAKPQSQKSHLEKLRKQKWMWIT